MGHCENDKRRTKRSCWLSLLGLDLFQLLEWGIKESTYIALLRHMIEVMLAFLVGLG